jgi:hypothetical protein
MSSVEYKEEGTLVLEHEGRKLEPAIPYTYMDDGTRVYAFAEAWNAVNVRLTTKEKRRNAPPNPETHDPTLTKDVHYYTIIFRLKNQKRGGLARNVVTKEVIDDLQSEFYFTTARRLKRMDKREAERKRKREERANNTNQRPTVIRRSARLRGESAELSESSEDSEESDSEMSDIKSGDVDIVSDHTRARNKPITIEEDSDDPEDYRAEAKRLFEQAIWGAIKLTKDQDKYDSSDSFMAAEDSIDFVSDVEDDI